jgi:hypothetical protein
MTPVKHVLRPGFIWRLVMSSMLIGVVFSIYIVTACD